jgi:hypothetical protein
MSDRRPELRITWIREHARGRIEADLGRRIGNGSEMMIALLDGPPSEADASAAATLTEKIYAAAAEVADLAGQDGVEVYLPLLRCKQWRAAWQAMSIESDGMGRLWVSTADRIPAAERVNTFQYTLALSCGLYPRNPISTGYSLAFTNRRTVPASCAAGALAPVLAAYGFDEEPGHWLAQQDGEAAVTLTLSVPGAAGECWLRAPLETEPEHFPVFSRISVAVQRALRNWIPFLYFSDLDAYDDVGEVWPLLFYRSLRPFPGCPRGDLTHDIVGPESIELTRQWNVTLLGREMAAVRRTLAAANRPELARLYAPTRAPAAMVSLRRQPRRLNALLAADAMFVNGLVQLAASGRAVRENQSRDTHHARRQAIADATALAASFNRKLRYLYGARNFMPIGSLVLVEATAALAGTRPAAELRLSSSRAERTFSAGS